MQRLMGAQKVWRRLFHGILCCLLFAQSRPAPAQISLAATHPITEILLRNVRWQTLPSDIRFVFPAPDHKLWFAATPGNLLTGNAAVKAEIEQQWPRAAPILHFSRPALLEKSGAIWFMTNDSRTLLRYDGQQWLQRDTQAPIQARRGFTGECPDHGHNAQSAVNADLNGVQFFIESNGVSAFDGTSWYFQPAQLPTGAADGGPWVILPEPGEKSALAIQANPPHVWRFKEGRFTEVPLPAAIKSRLEGVALAPSGGLLIQTDNRITRIPMGAAIAGPALKQAFNKALNKIDNPDPAVADAAAEAIVALGPEVRPLVQEILDNIVDRDAERRLQKVLADLNGTPAQAPFLVTGLDINQLNPRLFGDAAGNALIYCNNLPAGQTSVTSGVFVLKPDGTVRLCRNEGGLNPFGLSLGNPAPLFSNLGKTIWLFTGTGMQPFDLDVDPPTTQTSSDVGYPAIEAVADDGTVFRTANNVPFGTLTNNPLPLPLVAFKSNAPEDRNILHATAIDTNDSNAVLSSDGLLWSTPLTGGISHFDGKKWTTVLDRHVPATRLYPGKNGAVLVDLASSFVLLQQGAVLEATSLEQLMTEQSLSFTQAFKSPLDPALFRYAVGRRGGTRGSQPIIDWSLAIDKDAHLWYTMNGLLHVYNGRDWIEVSLPADSQSGGASRIIPIGDSSTMYVTGARRGPATRGAQSETTYFTAKYLDGSVKLSPAPISAARFYPFLDKDQALWITDTVAPTGRVGPPVVPVSNPPPPKVRVKRIGVDGVIDEFETESEPRFLDLNGVVWLAPINDSFPLWLDGKVAGRVEVPGATANLQIFSDKKGSIWVWTPLGLHHLLAAADNPTNYTVHSVYVMEGPEGNLFRNGTDISAGISPRGFIYTTTQTRQPRTRFTLYTVPTPD